MSANYTVQIDDDVQDVLKRSVIADNALTLPPGNLDRALYVKVNKVLELCGGKWHRGSKSHKFADDPRTRLGLALYVGEVVDTKKAKQQFFTPQELAFELCRRASITAGMKLLEPSAGAGSIALEARRSFGAHVECVEIDAALASDLENYHQFLVACTDFLKVESYRGFDRVVMNPPFTKGQDIQHVTHALKFLKANGLLVSVMGAGIKTNSTKAAVAFRQLVEDRGGYFEDLPEESFKESGTSVNTVVVVIPS